MVAVFGPEIGIGNSHTIEWKNLTTLVLIHGTQPRIVNIERWSRCCHLVDVEEQTMIANCIATEHVEIVDGAMVTNRRIANNRIIDSFR